MLLGTGNRASDEYLFFENELLTGYRKGNYKLKKPFEGFKGASWKQAEAAHDTLLINLRNDIGESNNLLKQEPQKVNEMYGGMQNMLENMGELPPSLFIRSNADKSHYLFLEEKHKTK